MCVVTAAVGGRRGEGEGNARGVSGDGDDPVRGGGVDDINEVGVGVDEVGEFLSDMGFGLLIRGDTASAIAIDGEVVGCNDVGDINVVDGGGDGVACFVRAG